MLILEKESEKKLYMQIYEYYKNRILEKGIEADRPLPSTRRLAGELSVSRNTVDTAYQQLLAEGYIYSRNKSGYYTADVQSLPSAEKKLSFRACDDTAEEDRMKLPGIDCNFQYGRLEPGAFPVKAWKRIADRVFRDTASHRITGYTSRTGEPELKEEIARYIYESRNAACEADRIVVCSGLLTMISLLCQLFMKKTAAIAIEEPCYDTVRNIFGNHGYDIDPVPVTKDGLDMDVLEKSHARLLYITPSHQFPTGRVISAGNRVRLLKWAEQNDAYIIEDDYDSEYRYTSRPISPLYSLDVSGRVIYVNTFSKALAPSLRMGFMVLPEVLKRQYDDMFSHYSCTVPLLTQLETAEFMASGQWSRHLRRISMRNRQKHDLLVKELEKNMGDRVCIIGSGAGLHFLLKVFNGMDEEQLIASAAEEGVKVYPVSQYYSSTPLCCDTVLAGFSSVSPEQIPEGAAGLRRAWLG